MQTLAGVIKEEQDAVAKQASYKKTTSKCLAPLEWMALKGQSLIRAGTPRVSLGHLEQMINAGMIRKSKQTRSSLACFDYGIKAY